MLKDNVKRCLSSEGIKNLDNVRMSYASMHIKRLLSTYNRKCPHSYEPHLPLCHSNRAVKVEIEMFLVDFLW